MLIEYLVLNKGYILEMSMTRIAKKLFNEMSTRDVKYHDVDSLESLLNIISHI